MPLQRTINRWTCLPASFATLLGLTLDDVLRQVGHDGSEIIFPDEPDPERRRAFHPQELIDVAERAGVCVTPIEARPSSRPRGVRLAPYQVDIDCVPRFQRYLDGNVGVVTGLNSQNRPHAVVWDGLDVWDPASGDRYGIHLFQPETFWRFTRRGAPLYLNLKGQ